VQQCLCVRVSEYLCVLVSEERRLGKTACESKAGPAEGEQIKVPEWSGGGGDVPVPGIDGLEVAVRTSRRAQLTI